jgi:phospholipid transport system substrate-binding protein
MSFFANASQDIGGYVQNLLNTTFVVLNDKTKSVTDKKTQLSQILADNLDSDNMAQHIIGRSRVDDSKIEEFSKAYKQYLVNSYASSVQNYNGQTVTIGKIIPANNGEYLVQTLIRGDNQDFKIDYKVRSTKDIFKIFDIITEGISLLETQKVDFGVTLKSSGIQTLIDELKARTPTKPTTQ